MGVVSVSLAVVLLGMTWLGLHLGSREKRFRPIFGCLAAVAVVLIMVQGIQTESAKKREEMDRHNLEDKLDGLQKRAQEAEEQRRQAEERHQRDQTDIKKALAALLEFEKRGEVSRRAVQAVQHVFAKEFSETQPLSEKLGTKVIPKGTTP